MTAVARAVSRPSRERVIVIGAVAAMVCLWASAFVAIRFADRELSPGALALGRLLVGSAALGILVLVRRAPLPRRSELAGIVVCGVLWFGVYNVALNAAERRVDAGSLVNGIGHAGASTVAWMIYLGVAPTAAGFVLWAYALARTTAGRMGSTTYLVPPLALLLGWAFLGEVPPALVLPGGALCLAGVALARTGGRRRSRVSGS